MPTAVSCSDIDAAKALGLVLSLLSLDSASKSLCMTRCCCSGGNPVCCCRPVRGQARRSGYTTGTSAAAAAIVGEIRLVWPVAGVCLCIERLRKKSLRVPDPETQAHTVTSSVAPPMRPAGRCVGCPTVVDSEPLTAGPGPAPHSGFGIYACALACRPQAVSGRALLVEV